MTVLPRRLAGAAIVVALVLFGAGTLVGCSDDTGDATTETTVTLVPNSTGDACSDPVGDLDLPVGVAADTPGLPGVDLTEASAKVDGDQLAISITTAGPIDQAPAATYVVAQGDPLGALSFELRMVHGSDGWSSTLVTWSQGKEVRESVPVTPVVAGSTLTASIPTSTLPAVALAMQFGSTATVNGAIVVDDCSSLLAG